MECHHRSWTANMVERRRAWHAIIAFGKQRRSDYVGRCMRSSPLGSTNGRTTSGVACHHRLCAAQAVARRQALHAIIAFGHHTRSNDVGRGMPSPSLDYLTQLDGVGRGMPSSPLDDKHGRMTSGVACHHRLWAAQTVERRRAWHAIIAFGKHTWSNDIGRGMPSSL